MGRQKGNGMIGNHLGKNMNTEVEKCRGNKVAKNAELAEYWIQVYSKAATYLALASKEGTYTNQSKTKKAGREEYLK